MKNTTSRSVRTVLAGMTAGAAVAAGILAGTGNANAVSLDASQNVRYMVCGNGVAEVDYTNVYGGNTETYVDLSQGCWFYDFYNGSDEYGYPDGSSYASVSVVDDNGGDVKCVIWVDGIIESRGNDSSDYYAYTGCY